MDYILLVVVVVKFYKCLREKELTFDFYTVHIYKANVLPYVKLGIKYCVYTTLFKNISYMNKNLKIV